MEQRIAISGISGPKVRSDCEILLELRTKGGVVIDLTSKVKSLYGESISELVKDVLSYFGIKDAFVKMTDSGALPFVISARIEAAVKQLVNTDLEYLPAFAENNKSPGKRDRFRFSRLYLPGNSPGLMINAGLHRADGLILDLEDSVAPEKKDEARILVRNALRQLDFCGAERMVRINQGERGVQDLKEILPHNVHLILIPKCESAVSIKEIEAAILDISSKKNINNRVLLMPIIESALGVERAFEIACSSDNIVAMAIGLEDYTTDLGVLRTSEAKESFYARSRIVVASKAAGIQPIDSVFSDVADMDGLRKNVLGSKALGFEGMGCIHPRQIKIIREGFAPDAEEIEKSKQIVMAYENARNKGLGVVSLGSKMIDTPVVLHARRTLNLAESLGLIDENWIGKSSTRNE
jgi:citrate lyase subunit beta/citryl-CoA lyase